jgi:hypothetical protein
MTARLMKASAIADTFTVERIRTPARPTAKPAAPRKRAPAKRTAATVPAPPPPVEPAPPTSSDARRRRFAFAVAGLVLIGAASSAAGFLLLRADGGDAQSRAAVSFALQHDGPVYWAGPMTERRLDLSSTGAGTFVRYAPPAGAAGDPARALTVATYPLRNAYATAVARAKTPRMTSRDVAGGGVAVWNRTRPTSVYLAFPGVSRLVEVYAPDAGEARTLALSGRIRPVR